MKKNILAFAMALAFSVNSYAFPACPTLPIIITGNFDFWEKIDHSPSEYHIAAPECAMVYHNVTLTPQNIASQSKNIFKDIVNTYGEKVKHIDIYYGADLFVGWKTGAYHTRVTAKTLGDVRNLSTYSSKSQ